MRAGGLRTRIVIEQDLGTETDSVGGTIEDWQPYHRTRARVAHRGGREFEAARQISSEITTLLVIRHHSDVDTRAMQAMRVRFLDDDSVADILYAIDPTRRRREIHIHASETH